MHEGHLLPHHAYLKNEIPVAGVAHQTGTCRFGTDPADSVLDTNCKAHELDNLYVVDTSFFPASAPSTRRSRRWPTPSGWGITCSSAWAPRGLRTMASDPHRVVIVGGGFGGLFAARRLRRGPVEVTLVDRHNHHLFQPMLYQVATGILSEGEIAPPIRSVLRRQRNVEVELAEVTGFDLEARKVTATR